MSIGTEHEGRSYPPSRPYTVSRAKIDEFAAALGDTSPAYNGDGGHGTAIAPPTFAAVIAARSWDVIFDDPELGLALHRTIHADQRFEITSPLRAGDRIVSTLTITKVRRRGPADMVTVSVRLDTVEGEPRCTAVSTLIHTRRGDAA
ncbi:MaoC family dehydratase N-terminal domain-containing protein [uncultured Propionibacterium sp.]|uniref:FAS1-like dehydratase domain-containing protein n=1 Tax=uncultured Propionibacterium sp. TaxID=218066 RepID=UPI0029319795|nr:MaoC family dehydratase N-terminal domain-containing protein [uncultured Propionibacterium sp.]